MGLFFMLGFRWSILASSGLSMDGIWMGFGEKKVNFPIIQTHDVWRWGRDDSFGLCQFSTFCLDRSVSPSLFLEKLTESVLEKRILWTRWGNI